MSHQVEHCWGCYQVVHSQTGTLVATVELNRNDDGTYRQEPLEKQQAETVANIIRQALDESGLG